MSIELKCAACGHEVPFEDGDLETESICPGCEVLLRRRSLDDRMAIPVSMALPDEFEPADLGRVPKHSQELIHRYQKNSPTRIVKTGDPRSDSNLALAKAIERLATAI
jgi:DNA-directed RNA polymerase subunit RPC12/RpoP